jgi:hypothetical protein
LCVEGGWPQGPKLPASLRSSAQASRLPSPPSPPPLLQCCSSELWIWTAQGSAAEQQKQLYDRFALPAHHAGRIRVLQLDAAALWKGSVRAALLHLQQQRGGGGAQGLEEEAIPGPFAAAPALLILAR